MPRSCLCFLNSSTSGCCYVVPFSLGNLKCGHLTLEWLYVVNVRKSLFYPSVVYLFLLCSIFNMAVCIFSFITSPKPLLLGWTLPYWLNSVELYHLYQLGWTIPSQLNYIAFGIIGQTFYFLQSAESHQWWFCQRMTGSKIILEGTSTVLAIGKEFFYFLPELTLVIVKLEVFIQWWSCNRFSEEDPVERWQRFRTGTYLSSQWFAPLNQIFFLGL